MSGYYYPSYPPPGDTDYDFNNPYPSQTTESHPGFPVYAPQTQSSSQALPYQYQYHNASQFYQQPQMYHPQQQVQPQHQQQPQQQQQQQPQQQSYQYLLGQTQPLWPPTAVPSNYSCQQQEPSNFPQFSESATYQAGMSMGPDMQAQPAFLSPKLSHSARVHRSTSLISEASSVHSPTQSDVSRSASPNATEMSKWGVRNDGGSWSCAYPGCTSRSTFNRGCDLRKHYKRHTKSLFCRVDGCPQASEGGFSSKKDRARHEAKHNPSIVCEWDGCDRLFSRQDNMVSQATQVEAFFSTDTRSRKIMFEGYTGAEHNNVGLCHFTNPLPPVVQLFLRNQRCLVISLTERPNARLKRSHIASTNTYDRDIPWLELFGGPLIYNNWHIAYDDTASWLRDCLLYSQMMSRDDFSPLPLI